MKTQSIAPTGVEQKFEANEMFFSTTDKKGVITAGNPVFARVSGYPLTEMLGQPHNLIRHRDMPRTVFQELWDAIKAGKIFLGYVKNHARDGNHYWVFASVIPVGDGFLSIRFKPSERGVRAADEIYGRMRSVEDQGDRKEAAQRARETLGRYLEANDFKSYESFSRAMLSMELKHRDEEIQRKGLQLFPSELRSAESGMIRELFRKSTDIYEVLKELSGSLETFAGINRNMQEKGRAILNNANNFRFSAMNAHIASDPLGFKGAPLSTVATFLNAYSRSLSSNVTLLAKDIEATAQALENVTTHISTTRLVLEMSIYYQAEIGAEAAGGDGERRVLKILHDLTDGFETLHAAATEELLALQGRLPQIVGRNEDLRKDIISLQVAQISGITEAVRIPEAEGIRAMMKDFRAEIDQAVKDLEYLGGTIEHLQEITNTTSPRVRRIQEDLNGIHAALTGQG